MKASLHAILKPVDRVLPPSIADPYSYTISTQHMSEAESTPQKTTVNIRMTETFLDDLDDAWKRLGYSSRSEFIRHVLRDAIKHPDFDRADLKAMLAGEVEIREGRTTVAKTARGKTQLEGPTTVNE